MSATIGERLLIVEGRPLFQADGNSVITGFAPYKEETIMLEGYDPETFTVNFRKEIPSGPNDPAPTPKAIEFQEPDGSGISDRVTFSTFIKPDGKLYGKFLVESDKNGPLTHQSGATTWVPGLGSGSEPTDLEHGNLTVDFFPQTGQPPPYNPPYWVYFASDGDPVPGTGTKVKCTYDYHLNDGFNQLAGVDGTGAPATYAGVFQITDTALGDISLSTTLTRSDLAGPTITDLLSAEFIALNNQLLAQAPSLAGSLSFDPTDGTMSFLITSATAGTATFAVDTTDIALGTSIRADNVPEPSTIVLLAIGSLGILWPWRRERPGAKPLSLVTSANHRRRLRRPAARDFRPAILSCQRATPGI